MGFDWNNLSDRLFKKVSGIYIFKFTCKVMKSIIVKPIINKANRGIQINLPRKKIPKKLNNNILNIKRLRINLVDWDD
jgi:hypothetical protein